MARLAIISGGLLASVSAIMLLVLIGRHTRAPAPDLAAVLTFADPSRCRPDRHMAALLEGLIVLDGQIGEPSAGGPVTLRGFAEPLQPRLEREFRAGRDATGYLTFAKIDLRGRWHGLNVVGLRTTTGRDFEIRFSDHPARVRDTLGRAGFPLPAVDQWRIPDYGLADPGVAMSVHAHRGGGASLICGS